MGVRSETIVRATPCDVKALPLASREAFFLSQLDGRLTLEEVAEIVAIDLSDALAIARKLVSLGAAEEVAPPGATGIRRRVPPPVEAAPAPPIEVKPAPPVTVPPVTMPPARVTAPPSSPSIEPPRQSGATLRLGAIDERVARLRAAALEIRPQARVDVLVRAAEEALRSQDFVAAANNFRLALLDREDPIIRQKLESVDAFARDIRFDRSVTRGRIAEQAQRWTEAALHLGAAHRARPDPAVAARASHAHRMNGDPRQAATFAEEAVTLAPRVVDYRILLADACLALGDPGRAEEEIAAALELSPQDLRVKELSAKIARKRKAL